MKASDFYGNASAVVGKSGGAVSMDVPAEQKPIGLRPVHFWLVMVGLLVVARVAYELSERQS